MRHWHVTTGNEYDGENVAQFHQDDMGSLVSAIHHSIDEAASDAYEEILTCRETHDDAGALAAFDLMDRLSTLKQTFHPDRAQAPLYRGNPAAWADTVRLLIEQHMPLRLSTSGFRLYVWSCDVDPCELGVDDE